MKIIHYIFIGILCNLLAISSEKNAEGQTLEQKIVDSLHYTEEAFSFSVNNGNGVLTGILSVPENFDTSENKAVILVSPRLYRFHMIIMGYTAVWQEYWPGGE